MSVPILPAAPGRLSMMTGCCQTSLSLGPTRRASKSVDPPGGWATIRRIGRSGKFCACAPHANASGQAAKPRTMQGTRRDVMRLPPVDGCDVVTNGVFSGLITKFADHERKSSAHESTHLVHRRT